jgi:penicillin-binding protein 1A
MADHPKATTSSSTDSNGSGSGAEADARLTARQQADQRRARKAARKEARRERRRERPKLKKLRVALVFTGLGALAIVSWVFGVMMAVAQDLPDLEARAQFDRAENSVVFAKGADGEHVRLATLTGNEHRILLDSSEISPLIKQAVVAIEDERFYEHRGIDYAGIARALWEDIRAGGTVQGGSTITQQFVKNALAAQESRTVLEKLKEAALAYQIERQWSKDKILTNYLNNIYFGEGAYGIEAAAKTFFGDSHPGCGGEGDRCASQLRVEEAALLAGMISSPTAYSPKLNPSDAEERRNLVLQKMRDAGVLSVTDEQFAELTSVSLPAPSTIEPPREESEAPYFTDWLRQQIVDRYGAGDAFGGGLEIRSTLDLELQQQAQEIVASRTAGLGPTAAVVAIENGTGKVRAMVGGTDFQKSAFNLATNGLRQPGSSFKPFTLVTALEAGVSPTAVYPSAPKEIQFEHRVRKKNGEVKVVPEIFKVSNYEDNYLGSASLTTATTYSDNSVYAEVGTDVGTDAIAKTARKMGIQSKVPTNPAMILGGLKRGVTPLEMAYAYSTLANRGKRISGTMASRGNGRGPVAIEKVEVGGKPLEDHLGASGENETTDEREIDEPVADQAVDMLHTVVTSGTGRRAQVGDDFIWGKTGTTDNNADAWFVGANEKITVAVWVGYAEGATPMLTEFGGAPVDGGTLPALIWHDVVAAFDEIDAARREADQREEDATTTPGVAPAPAPAPESAPAPAPEPAPEPVPEEPKQGEAAPATPPAQQQQGGAQPNGGGAAGPGA